MAIVYPWQQGLWDQFQRIRVQNRVPHALLLTGQRGMGLDHFAHAMANTILCQKKDAPCGQCQDCLLFDAHNHPDFFLVERQKKSTQITVNQIRELIDFTQLTSFSGRAKIALIKQADDMNRYAANNILKLLEEPARNTFFMLVTRYPMVLPITVRSRCQRFNMKAAIDENTLNWVHAHLKDRDCSAQQALQLAGGAPLLATAAEKKDMLAMRNTVLIGFIELIEGKQNPLKLAHHWYTIGCEQILDWLLQLNYKMVRYKLSSLKLNIGLENTGKERLQYHIKRLNLIQLVKSYEQIMRQYTLMLSPVHLNTLGLLESLTIYWKFHLTQLEKTDYE